MKKKTTKTSRAGVRVSSNRPAGSTAASRRVTRKTQSERRTSKPRTAYELLERVAQHIEAEPLRYDQEEWGVHGEALLRECGYSKLPSCGTVACRAGWIVALHDGARAVNGFWVPWRAKQILGTEDGVTDELFYSLGRGTPGTRAHAKVGVSGIRRFMKQHESHLKARRLSDVPKLEGPS